MNTVPSCTKCHEPMEVNPLSEELTCFVHGNPNGSEFEKMVWENTK